MDGRGRDRRLQLQHRRRLSGPWGRLGSGPDGSSITLAAAPTKAGFTFAGWNDGTTTYAAGASYTLNSNGAAAIIFTAQWTAVVVTDAYSYNTAGGSRPRPVGQWVLDGSSITLAAAPTKAGFTFAGWNDGTTTYAAGASYTLNSNGARRSSSPPSGRPWS